MVSPSSGAAARYSRWTVTILGAALAAGCVGYEPKPLPMQNYNQVLERRSAGDANVTSASLTLPDAEQVALYLNPRVRAARQEANVAEVDAQNSGTWDDPILSGDALRVLHDSDHGHDNRNVLGASLLFTIPISGRLHVEKEQARAESRAAIVRAWGVEQEVLHELRDAWSDWSATNDANRLAGSRYNGIGSASRLRILGLMGLPANANVDLVANPSVEQWNGTPDDIYRTNPNVLLRQAEYDVAEQTLRLETRKQYPDINLGPAYEHRSGNNRAGFGFNLPIPILNGNRGAIKRAEAAREAARAAWEAAVEQAFSDYSQAIAAREYAAAGGTGIRSFIPRGTENYPSTADTSLFPWADGQLGAVNAGADRDRANAALWHIIPKEAPTALPTQNYVPGPVSPAPPPVATRDIPQTYVAPPIVDVPAAPSNTEAPKMDVPPACCN